MIRTYRAGTSSTAPDKSSANSMLAKLAAFREARAASAKRTAGTKPSPRIAQMHSRALLAALTDEQKAGLAAKLGFNAPRSKASRAAPSQSRSDAVSKAAEGRAIAVLSHEHAQGRMDVAKTLLANNKLSADDIINILSISTSNEVRSDGAAEMRQVLAEIKALNASPAPAAVVPGRAAAIWERAYARLAASEFEA